MALAIVLIDLQKDFFLKDYKDQVYSKQVEKSVVAQVNRLLTTARGLHIPIIHVLTSYRADRSDWTLRMRDIDYAVCIENTWGEELVDGMAVLPGEHVVKKNRYSAFINPQFETLLHALDVDTLVTCGINTHACVRSTVIDAFMRDYRVLIPQECIGSYDPAHHDITLKYMRNRIACLLSTDEMIARLKSGNTTFQFS